jgi:hypothetical protein
VIISPACARATFLLAALALAGPQAPAPASGQPERVGRIIVSANGRFFQHEDGTAFFWLGDTAWNLFQRLDRDEAERYLENRRAKGFNVIQAVAFHGAGEANAYGSQALVAGDAGRPNITLGADPSKPGEYDYWDHIDWVVDLAASKGLYVAILPVWGSSVQSKALNAGNVDRYARFLAARYGGKPNIIWITGGDIRGDVSPDVWKALGRTLKQADPNHLITFHPFGRTQSSTWFHGEPWLDFDMFQSGHRRHDQDPTPGAKGEENWRYVEEDYARTPPKPTLDGEPSYENIPQGLHDFSQPYWTDKECRRYAYWSVFAGAAGHTYGNNAVMQMHKPGVGPGSFGVRNYWYEAIDEPGAAEMQHLKHLMLSRPYLERIPDQSLVAGDPGTRDNHVVATRGRSYLFAYAYTGRPIDVRMGIISGEQVRAWWFSPRDGSAKTIGVFSNRGVRTFVPPGAPAPGNDWVLVLDDVAQEFPVPGVPSQQPGRAR